MSLMKVVVGIRAPKHLSTCGMKSVRSAQRRAGLTGTSCFIGRPVGVRFQGGCSDMCSMTREDSGIHLSNDSHRC
jgi:hypothetical protein